ncbi:MAG: electron transfer flavoprotein subunit alpha/FixB family protein [Nitrososphaerales archaeon]
MMQQSGVLIYSEVPEASLELITLAKSIGIKEIIIASIGSKDQIPKLSAEGVTKIYSVERESLMPEQIVDALGKIYDRANKPKLVFIGSTRRGREIAPRLATRLMMGCITDALKIDLSTGKIRADRLVWGGNAISTVEARSAAVLTVPLRSAERGAGVSNPEVIDIGFEPGESKVKLLGKKERSRGQVNIKDADTVISAGRGFKKKEDLALLDGLAKTLNAVIGASRPLTSDLGWIPEDRQVGLSGTTVKPKLYIAIGISGQIQHLTGMRDSKLVVAINSDKNAPIFQECDYGIVGDLYTVVPELDKALVAQLHH